MILDIGCGNNPKGNVNIDVKRKHVPNFVLCDASTLPFREKTFSIAYSSHVLEHIHNPLKALSEWKRVSTSLYILTPGASHTGKTLDHIFSWNSFTLKNLLSLQFNHVSVAFTGKIERYVRGRLGKYMPLLNILMSKLGFQVELCARAW